MSNKQKRQQSTETPDSERSPDIEKYKLIRERWDKEDELLLSRTGIFLTANSILGAALGFQVQSGHSFRIGVASVGLILSILWLLTSLVSFNIIRRFFLLSKDDMPHGLKESYRSRFIHPNTVFCKLIPGLIIAGWVGFIIWSLISMPK
jgi:hypothetical protein